MQLPHSVSLPLARKYFDPLYISQEKHFPPVQLNHLSVPTLLGAPEAGLHAGVVGREAGGSTLPAEEREHSSVCTSFQLREEEDVGLKHGAKAARWPFAQLKPTWAARLPGPPQATDRVLCGPAIKTWG